MAKRPSSGRPTCSTAIRPSSSRPTGRTPSWNAHPAYQPAPPKSYSPSLYAVLGLVVLALAYGGYSYYSQTDTQISERQPEVRQAQTVTSAPAVTPSPIPLQGTEEKLPPPQKS